MSGLVVVEIPQWQGSSSVTARRLSIGARALADQFPAARHVYPQVDVQSGGGEVTDGVRDLGILERNLAAIRAELERVNEPRIITVGGDCGVELAPIERAHRRHGERLAVVWFDAHGDLNTPATSPSGGFHGMVLRTLLGEGPDAMSPAPPLGPSQVILAGVRALDAAEHGFIDDHRIRHVSVTDLSGPSTLAEAVSATGADAVYVHIDLDVLDPDHFGSVGVPEPGGLSVHRLADSVRVLGERLLIAGIGITEHQPAADDPTETDAGVLELLARTLTDVATGQSDWIR